MRKIVSLASIAVALLVVLAACGCSRGSSEAESKTDQALELIETSQPLLEDLLDLDGRFNTLGTRFPNVEDTIAEGKSLAEMALFDVDELEARYSEARDLFREVADMPGAGDYAGYARLALDAVEKELEAVAVNRDLLNAVWDMLDVLPLAESQQQLSYYVEEIDRLTTEVSALMQEAAEAAAAADRFHEEHNL